MMKFLFLSTDSKETLIEKTILFCLKNAIQVVRLNLEDLIPNNLKTPKIAINQNDVQLTIDNEVHYLSEFELIWKRRIDNNFISGQRVLKNYRGIIPNMLIQKLIKEFYELRDLVLHFARSKGIRIINDFDNVCLNKPFQSIRAKDFGLNTPKILVSNSTASISTFISSNNTITKPIGSLGYFVEQGQIMSIKTANVNLEDINTITSNEIFPSFFQEYVKSSYELKCILVGDNLFCVKQFCEIGIIPTTDIKEAYKNKQIKNIEYALNPDIKKDIIRLCHSYKLDLCTVDIIRNLKGEYVFIEINPDGIIEYYGEFLENSIHKSILKMLLKKSKQNYKLNGAKRN